jgi:thiol:disulfide interchange protein DsbD
MASAVGVALTLAPWQAMLVFLSLGFGLALPFLLISFSPPLLRLLPKPGAWMNGFKHVLAFAMYGSAIWLLWVLTLQVGASGMVIALAGILFAVFALVMIRHNFITIVFIIAAVFASLNALSKLEMESVSVPITHAKHQVETVDFSMAKIQELRAAGKTVFVDATAAWCITCQVNARVAIHTDSVMAAFREHGAVLMIADWTSRNPEITQFLASFGYNGVPLYVVYPPEGEPKVLPQLLTPEIVIEAIR